jgi:RNA polymerase sigma factor (sigma-70 family)
MRAALSFTERTVAKRTVEDKLIIQSFLLDRTEDTFFPLFETFCPRVRRFFLLHCLDVCAAEDLSQEVFFRVYCKANELREAGRFCGWMYAIARNVLISYWRQQKARIAEAQLEHLMAGMYDGLVTEAEVMPKLRLMEWLEELEADERDLLILRFVEGLSYKELAVALNIPVGTVKWRISEVRRKLSLVILPSNNHNGSNELRKKVVGRIGDEL